ncbi:MAG: hypothetical protein RLZZ383_968 [Pseudomonadota bacterium]
MAEQGTTEDLAIRPDGAGVAFRTEMAVSNFVLGYWKPMVGVVVAGLVGTLVYGLWSNEQQAQQRTITGEIADVIATQGLDLQTLAQQKALSNAEKPFDGSKAATAAASILAIAEKASGVAAYEGAMKAAEFARFGGDAATRRAALDLAQQRATDPVFQLAAAGAIATLDVEEGKGADAVTRFDALRADKGFVGRRAALELASVQEALGRVEEAKATLADLVSRWPDAPEKVDVDARLARLGTAAGQGSPAANPSAQASPAPGEVPPAAQAVEPTPAPAAPTP